MREKKAIKDYLFYNKNMQFTNIEIINAMDSLIFTKDIESLTLFLNHITRFEN